MKIGAQEGPQYNFLDSTADIAIFGGSAGGGKSYALLLEPLRHIHNPQFGGVILRRTSVQIRIEGGLWDTSQEIYPLFAGRGYSQQLTWRFPSGASISMAGMEREKDKFNWQGAQIPYIAYDELTHFSRGQFWYMMARNRSASGIAGYIRGACNPDPDSWVKEFIQWWLNPETGLAIQERSGVVRWFVTSGDSLQWADNPKELKKKFGPECEPKSATFIPASVYDNKKLLEKDPAYLANLKNLPYVEREQLLHGNWNVRPAAGSYFKRHYFGIVDAAPADRIMRVRYWDRAATEKRSDNDPDATSGTLLSRDRNGIFYIEDRIQMFATPHAVNQAMLNTAQQDGRGTMIGFNQDPGSAGVYEAQDTARMLAGYSVTYGVATGDKETRAKPVSSQAEAGNIKLVRGPWNEGFIRELENFPIGAHDDDVDSLSGAFEMVVDARVILLA